VLSISISRTLFPRFERSSAGRLTKIRAQAVSRRACVEVARATGVPERVMAAAPAGFEHQAQRLVASGSVLAEAVEAGIGACFLEFGFEETSEAVAAAFEPAVEFAVANTSDFKSELQERLAQRGALVSYRVVSEEGPPHERRFETAAEVDGELLGSGSGRSKKESEQQAAREALVHLDERERKG
jgi:ribonuclease-3